MHIAARVMAAAQPGDMLASGTVHDLVVGADIYYAIDSGSPGGGYASAAQSIPSDSEVLTIEHVLDLASRYFWLVGPGTAAPEQHGVQVGVEGLNARFV